jgi:hypothetical protein
MVVKIVYGVSVTHDDVCTCGKYGEDGEEDDETDMETDLENETDMEDDDQEKKEKSIELRTEPNKEQSKEKENGSATTNDENKCKCPNVGTFDRRVKLTQNVKAISIDVDWRAEYYQIQERAGDEEYMIFGVFIGELDPQYTGFMVINENLLPTQKTKQDFQNFLDRNPILKDLIPKVMIIEDMGNSVNIL